MRVLNNLKVQHKCISCKLRAENFFCNVPQPDLQVFESLKVTNTYPKGTILFIEGQPAGGVYMLCQGRVKLSTCSRDGKVIILRIAEAGEVLGLSATVSNSVFEATAEVLEPCQVNFVRREDFLRYLQQNVEACLSAVKKLSGEYHTTFTQMRSLGLSASISDRLVKLFLGWCKENDGDNGRIHLKISYTHEELAQMIGTSRETVSRLLKDFKDRNLVTLKGSDLIVHDKKKLEEAIGQRIKPHL